MDKFLHQDDCANLGCTLKHAYFIDLRNSKLASSLPSLDLNLHTKFFKHLLVAKTKVYGLQFSESHMSIFNMSMGGEMSTYDTKSEKNLFRSKITSKIFGL